MFREIITGEPGSIPPEDRAWTWREHQESPFAVEEKSIYLGPKIVQMSQQGLLGRNVLAVGAGDRGPTAFLDRYCIGSHKIIDVDLLGPEKEGPDLLRLVFDVEKALSDRAPEQAETRSAINRICGFLGNPDQSQPRKINTLVLSDILNYVDFASVIRFLEQFIVPGGRIFISNQINRTCDERLLSLAGLQSNEKLIGLLKELGYEIEGFQRCILTTTHLLTVLLGTHLYINSLPAPELSPLTLDLEMEAAARENALMVDDLDPNSFSDLSISDAYPIFVVARKAA